jgi:hypothetical protein
LWRWKIDEKQIKAIAKILQDNYVSLETWDHYNDDFNHRYDLDCERVAKLLVENRVRIEVEE